MTCQGCANRHEACHDDCPIYAEFRKRVDAENEARRKAAQDELFARHSYFGKPRRKP